MSRHTTVVVGAGHAGVELAVTLRQRGYDGRVLLLGDEPGAPYHRPPLSKSYLTGTPAESELLLRSAETYDRAAIELESGATVTAIDPVERQLSIEGRPPLRYDKLALALGGRPRPLPFDEQVGALRLRNRFDADRLRATLTDGACHLLIIGAGFIGLEIAAAARARGVRVTVVEAAARVLSRVASPQVSAYFADAHRRAGVELRLNNTVTAASGSPGAVRLRLSDGTHVEGTHVVSGVGMAPTVELARAAGLLVDDGILIAADGVTSNPHVVAAGDCTRVKHPAAEGPVRFESVQAAVEQGRAAAHGLLGLPPPPAATPWFWSDQADDTLQVAGVMAGTRSVTRGDLAGGTFSVVHLAGPRIVAIEAVNSPRDFAQARRLIGAGTEVDVDALHDTAVALADHAVGTPSPSRERSR